MVRRVRSLSIALVILLVSSVLSGQQPKQKRQPYVAPLLPAEQAWRVTLPAPPAAAAVMDERTIYVPLEQFSRTGEDDVTIVEPAVLAAIARDTGAIRWKEPVTSDQPPVLAQDAVVVATGSEIRAFDPERGKPLWSVALERRVRAPMIACGSLLLAMLEGDELFAINLERRVVAWKRNVGESGPLLMTTDEQAVYVATAAGRVSRILLSDGSTEWERRLTGELTEPTVDKGQLFVGSTRGSLWALDVRKNGKNMWFWQPGRLGPVVGSVAQGDDLYVVSRDLIVRALDRASGAQQWKKSVGSRPVFPPRAFAGVVAIVGYSLTLATFKTDGTPVSSWTGPADALLQGPPLIENPRPFAVSIVLVFRDGQMIGLRSTEMLFREPAVVPITVLPGRALARETLPDDPGAR